MAQPLSAARRVFAPTLRFTLLALLAAALFARLGIWQWHKGEERQAAAARFARGTDQVFELGPRAVDDMPLYQRVSVDGALDGAHQFLLDNRIFAGRAASGCDTRGARAGTAHRPHRRSPHPRARERPRRTRS